ncbi:MAG: protein-L-isoaspartate O-methyltransferase [Parvibaculaceae bacterium]
MVDFSIQRLNMVESQVRPNGVTDARIIAAMGSIPRERFVPEGRRAIAYMDEEIIIATTPTGRRRYLIEPMVLARLLQLAALKPTDILLDIGCGTGYSTAVAAALAESVVAVEENAGLAQIAGETLSELGIANAAVVQGPHAQGLPSEAPFDVILINGRVPAVPQALVEQLKPGGRLVAVVGTGPVSRATLVRQTSEGQSSVSDFDANVPDAPGFEIPQQGFVF